MFLVNKVLHINYITQSLLYLSAYIIVYCCKKFTTNMEISNLLEQFGLKEKETKLYLACLEMGQSTASQLSKKTSIQRTLIYDIAQKLIDRGMMTSISKKNKSSFSAISPQSLLKLEEQKVSRLKKMLPQLEAMYGAGGGKAKIYYYEGKAGIDHINNETLRYRGEIVGFTTPLYVNFQQKYISKEYADRRREIGNRVRIIGEQSPEIIELKRHDSDFFRETKIVSKNLFSSDIELGVYGESVFVIDYKEEVGFIIENKSTAKTLKRIFDLVWNNADNM